MMMPVIYTKRLSYQNDSLNWSNLSIAHVKIFAELSFDFGSDDFGNACDVADDVINGGVHAMRSPSLTANPCGDGSLSFAKCKAFADGRGVADFGQGGTDDIGVILGINTCEIFGKLSGKRGGQVGMRGLIMIKIITITSISKTTNTCKRFGGGNELGFWNFVFHAVGPEVLNIMKICVGFCQIFQLCTKPCTVFGFITYWF